MSHDIDPALFRETLGHYPTGVAVITAIAADGNPVGMVVGTFSSVSMNPPLIAFYPMSNSKSFAQIRTAPAFCVNVLAADQEQFCREFSTGGATKFDTVNWRPGPLGSPILEQAVSWIECTMNDIREAGDHYIALGAVHDLAVQRSTLPLLFFQGGYGRFSPGSFIATPDPELIQAAQRAETIRTQVEQLSTRFAVNCSVLAKINWDAVQVLAANQSPADEPFPLGHRQPLMPPFGAIFMANAPEHDIDQWLMRAPDHSEERRELNRGQLDQVRRRGYSLLAAGPEVSRRHHAILSEFESQGRLPRHERAVKDVTSELADFFFTDLVQGETYDLANIVVLLETKPGLPPMALRMTGLPPTASAGQIELWIDELNNIARLEISSRV